jgi:hypothetical protein
MSPKKRGHRPHIMYRVWIPGPWTAVFVHVHIHFGVSYNKGNQSIGRAATSATS